MTKKKVVWYISKYGVSRLDGTPTRHFFISKYLARQNHDVILISSVFKNMNQSSHVKGIGKERKVDGFKHILLNGPKIDLGFNLKRIFSWIIFEIMVFISPWKFKLEKPDIVIISSLSLLTILNGLVFKLKYKSKLILEIRDIWPLTLVEVGNFSRFNPLIIFLRYVEKLGYCKSDLIIGTMPNLREHIKNSIKKEFQFVHIPMGYDPEYYDSYVYKNEFPLDEYFEDLHEKFIVAYAGTIGRANGIDIIIEVAKILEIENNKIFFVLIGNGPLREQYIAEIKGLSNIRFLPAVEKKLVNSFLIKTDLLVHPICRSRLYKFGVSPNKWIDYMYSGKPIIVPYNGYQSVINEAKCGVFIEPDNASVFAAEIIRFFNMPKKLLNEYGRNGKMYLKNNLSYSILVQKLSEKF